MTTGVFITFASALLLMVITPGPGVLACVSRGLTSGFRMSAFVALGIISGDMFFVLMTLYGLATVARLLGDFFAIVRYSGAIYLIWLGYRTWTSTSKMHAPQSQAGTSPTSSFLSGLGITLGNPKVIVFYLSVLPAFLDLNRLTTSDAIITMAIVLLTLATVLSTYSFVATRFRVVFRSRRALKNINRCSGGAMITAGVAMVVKE